jgi:hypothetical protein
MNDTTNNPSTEPKIVLERGVDYSIILIPQVHGIEEPTAARRRTLRRIHRENAVWAKQFREVMGP